MSRISKCAALVLSALMMLGCLSEDTLISPDKITDTGANYKTAECVVGTFQKVSRTSCRTSYPYTYTARYEGPTARFEQYYVKRNDTVKQGDIIAAFTVDADEVALYSAQINLTRAEESREETLKAYDEEIARLDSEIATITDPYEKENARLRAKIKRLEKERYVLTSDNHIASLTEQLEELEKNSVTQYVYAPADGVISELTYFKSKETVYNGTYVLTMYNPDVVLFECDDESSEMRYGMNVTVTAGSAKQRCDYYGRVIACGCVLPGKSSGTTALVELEGYEASAHESVINPVAAYNPVYLENVVTIDKKTVTMSGGKYYLYKLSGDGMVSKRYIQYVQGNVNSDGWVLDGLTPGETVIIN